MADEVLLNLFIKPFYNETGNKLIFFDKNFKVSQHV